jgi:pimeloyl-ACP methyl ester carboxylesterase
MRETKSGMFNVDGVALYAERQGSGPQVVCLTALGHDAHDFDALIKRLGDRFEFIRIEWPGHGRSGPDKEPASATRYGHLFSALAPALGLNNPIIIGNSIGGAVSLIYAAAHPVRGLVLCNSAGLLTLDRRLTGTIKLFERFFAAGVRGAWWYPSAFALYYRLVLREPAARAQRKKIIANARKMVPILREAWASFSRPESYLVPLVERVTSPVWIAWAEKELVSLDQCQPAISKLRDCRVSKFKAGHCAFLEQPDQFAEQFANFATATRAGA